jgi:Skp family chaperone for outer membrane proteins
MKTDGNQRPSSGGFFNLAGLLALLCVVPAALAAFGRTEDALFLERAVGPFGAPGSLLLAGLALLALRVLFGSGDLILPQLVGTLLALCYFGASFNLPWLGFLRAAASRFPAFSVALPPLAAGVSAAVLGVLLSKGTTKSGLRALAVAILSVVVFVAVGGYALTPKVDPAALSVDASLRRMAEAVGAEYRDPVVDAAVKKVLEDQEKSVEAKTREIEELKQRLQKSESDREAIAKRSEEDGKLSKELEEANRKLQELQERMIDTDPALPGGAYERAVQPLDPAVRDFAVSAAMSVSGAFDAPQGSRKPTVEGLRQAYLVHTAVASKWKYVSDPGVSWSEYLSPARRTLKLGLAGDCDDFAAMTASCVTAVGGRTRIVHGFDSRGGHAWAELYLGTEPQARSLLAEYAQKHDRSASSWSLSKGPGSGVWLPLDWKLGSYSSRADRFEIAWEGK